MLDKAVYGEKGLILRREGLYYDTAQRWRKQIDKLQQAGQTMAAKNKNDPSEVARLKRELAKRDKELIKAKRDLEKAHSLIEIQKKVSLFLEQASKDLKAGGSSS